MAPENEGGAPAHCNALIVDDDQGFREVLKGFLESRGMAIRQAASGEEALQEIGKSIPDIVFLDIFMPGLNGLESLKLMRSKYPKLKVIVMSGYATVEIAKQAIDLGAFDYINKPIELEHIDDILPLITPHRQGGAPALRTRVKRGAGKPVKHGV